MVKSIKLFFSSLILSISLIMSSASPVLALSFPAEINKEFTPIQIDPGETSILRVYIYNPNSFQLTNAGWTDNLVGVQPGMYLVAPGLVFNNCGGAVTAVPGQTTFSLSGGTVPAQSGPTPGQCYVEVAVSSITPGNLINTIGTGLVNGLNAKGNDGGTIVDITNTTPASATLVVSTVTPPTLTKSYSSTNIFVGQTSRLTITLNNNDTTTNLSGVSYTDNLPVGTRFGNQLILATPVNATITGCGGYSLTANPGGTQIALTNATVTPSVNCVVAVDVTGLADEYSNVIPAGPGAPAIQSNQGVTNPAAATAQLNIQPIRITKSFSPTSFQVGGTTTLTIRIQNPTASAYTNVTNNGAALDALPAPFVVAPTPGVTNSCVGSVTAAAGSSNISISGLTVPGGSVGAPGECLITVQVTATAAASNVTNTIASGTLASPDHPTLTNFPNSTATISAYAVGVGLIGAKSFSPATIDPGQNTRLRIDLTAPLDTNLTNFSITDDLSLIGLTITNSTPASKTANCIGGTLTATTGTNIITWAGGTINAGQLCRIDVYVTSNTAGAVTNRITPAQISNTENRDPAADITAVLNVTQPSDLSVSKVFTPNLVVPSGITRLRITIQNTNALPITGLSVLDDLASMGSGGNAVRVAPTPNGFTDCGGTFAPVAGASTVSLTGGTVPPQNGGVPGICTIEVNVRAQSNTGTRTNTITNTNISGQVQGSGTTIFAPINATATLQTTALSLVINKEFDPNLVYGGASSELRVILDNPSATVALTGIAFTDDMTLLGSGMVLANPVSLNEGTCGGTLTGNPGDTSFSFSGGSLAAGATCTLTLRATLTVNGNITNRIPAGSVTTLQGATNAMPVEASLSNLAGASVGKAFSPGVIIAGSGGVSTLTITINNTTGLTLTQVGLVDNLPVGLNIAAAPAAINNCSTGSLTAMAGTQLIELIGGTLGPNSSCTLVVPVTSDVPGSYTNTIPINTLTNTQGYTNTEPAEDTLIVTGFSLGNRVWEDNGAGGGTADDGVRNGTEPGIDGVTVNLYRDSDDNGTPDGAAIATMNTAGGGFYRFDNLKADTYIVEVVTPAGFSSSSVDAGDADADVDDDDDNGVVISGVNVRSNPVTLGPTANEPTGETNPATNPEAGEAVDNQSNRTVDFGFVTSYSLGNRVWDDNGAGGGTASDGLRNGTEPGLDGVTVNLYRDSDDNGTPDGAAIATMNTAGGGFYRFDGLRADTYIVEVVPPAGYTSTMDAGDPDADAGDDDDNGVVISGANIRSNPVTLGPGNSEPTGETNPATNPEPGEAVDNRSNRTVDFGFITSYSLGNRVWDDNGAGGGTASDGLRNGTEPGIDGVTVNFTVTQTTTAHPMVR
ncbi:SdrD B-like domain-containing protein [Candidatus Villigracilis affinis]|uniref:beta strand repeat-containing protein n=1 Tax=Candidatus Villigracilis affinis TaxID=3140682 RepID=UPI002A225873|nr:hypothetical protein [Anaerolineales bacterium]